MTNHERLKNRLTKILTGTDKDHPMEFYAVIGEEEAFGVSSLELPVVIGAFLDSPGNNVCFRLDGLKDPIDCRDLSEEDLAKILEALEPSSFMGMPEKIYVHGASAPELTEKLPFHVEYIRPDVFLDKTEEFLYRELNEGNLECSDITRLLEDLRNFLMEK